MHDDIHWCDHHTHSQCLTCIPTVTTVFSSNCIFCSRHVSPAICFIWPCALGLRNPIRQQPARPAHAHGSWWLSAHIWRPQLVVAPCLHPAQAVTSLDALTCDLFRNDLSVGLWCTCDCQESVVWLAFTYWSHCGYHSNNAQSHLSTTNSFAIQQTINQIIKS